MRPKRIDVAWAAFCVANVVAMVLVPSWETIPFHFIWTSLSILYGFRVWQPRTTVAILLAIGATTGVLILVDAENGTQEWGELFEVPLMSLMFLAMVWHARRRQAALETIECQARERAQLLNAQEQFMHDISHELRTPLTIARGHVELLKDVDDTNAPVAAVALDELDRLGRLVDRLLALAKARHTEPVTTRVALDELLEEVVMRWAGVAPRVWRAGELEPVAIDADPDALRIAVDALIENAVEHTRAADTIELSAVRAGDDVLVEVADTGSGIPADALERIFERFSRVEAGAQPRRGLGLGLAIVDAIVKSHGGSCSARSSSSGSVFTLCLPLARGAPAPAPVPPAELLVEDA